MSSNTSRPPPTRHLLVEQHEVIRVFAKQLKCVVTVSNRIDMVAASFQKEQVWLEEMDFVVHPKNSFRASSSRDWHGTGLEEPFRFLHPGFSHLVIQYTFEV